VFNSELYTRFRISNNDAGDYGMWHTQQAVMSRLFLF